MNKERLQKELIFGLFLILFFLITPIFFNIIFVLGDITTKSGEFSTPRSDTASVYDPTTSKFYTFGGHYIDGTTVNYLSQIAQYTYSTDTVTATSIGTLPVQLTGASAAYKDSDEIYIFGGYDKTNSEFNTEIFKFDPSSPSSNAVDTTYDLPTGMKDASAVYDSSTDKFYIFGGYYLDGSGDPQYLNTIVQFDPTTGVATTTSIGTLTVELTGASAVYKDADEIYIFGGYNNTNSEFNAKIFKFDPSSPASNAVDTTYVLPSGRKNTSAVYAGGKFYIYGGYYLNASNSVYLNQIIEFDSSDGTVTDIADDLPASLRGSSAGFNTGSNVYIFGGYNNTNSVFSDSIYMYTLPNAAPTVSSVQLNSAGNITLTEGTTTPITCTGTITDTNGGTDVSSATSTIYRSAVGSTCSTDVENCYLITSGSCVLGSADGNNRPVTCTANIQFYADATDSGTYSAENWLCNITGTDSQSATGSAVSSTGVEMNSLAALDATASLDYGTLAIGGDTASVDETSIITNKGNTTIDIQLSGYGSTSDDGNSMVCDVGSVVISYEKYSVSASTAYASKTSITGTPGDNSLTSFDLAKGSSSTKNVYWGFGIPSGSKIGGNCTGNVEFTAVAN